MPRRSVLFSPGDRPEMLRKAPGSGADVVVFDLEDAVAPARKDEARAAVAEVVTDPGFDPDCEVCVRLSSTPGRDLDAVAASEGRLDSVMIPKVNDAGDVERVADLLGDEDIPVIALIETAGGVLDAGEIAAAEATDGLAFGAEDYTADVGAIRTDEGTEVLYAREKVVAAAGAAGVDALDTVYTDFEDDEGLAEEADFAVQLGFDGKLAIHPRQVGVINDAFTPTPERIEWARKVLAARDEADEAGRGVFQVDGEMIDAPLIAQAERIVQRAAAADEI